MEYVSRQSIYFDMLDSLHTVHNAAYLYLFERARMELALELSRRDGEDLFEMPCCMVRNEVNYRAQITEMQDVHVTVAVAELGRTSVTFAHTVTLADGKVAADGRAVIVRLDAQTRQATPWSDRFRDRLKPYLMESP